MNKTFKLIKDYYDAGYNLFNKDSVTINEGVTVLVGCNGTGKSTLLHILNDQLEDNNVPHLVYNDKNDGGHNALDKMLFYNRFEEFAQRAFASEGEEIVLNFGEFIAQIRQFFKNGNSTRSFRDPNPECLERWILFDAVDSGMSIDNMKEIKELFDLIINDAKSKGLKIYIVISTNSFEFAKDSRCLDVHEVEYVSFVGYDEYSNFVMESRAKKDNRS